MKHEITNLRTKRTLAASLKRFLEKKPLSKITVSEIADDCGINRKTFYYHFEDIYALFRWMLQQETGEVVKQFDLQENYSEAVTYVMDYVMENKHILNSAMDSIGRAGLQQFFYEDFKDIVRSCINFVIERRHYTVDEDYKNFQCEFFTQALSGMILSWCADEKNRVLSREKTLEYLLKTFTSALPNTLAPEKQA